jgi:peptidoglycan hydrolase CwlO-like protein
MSLNPNDSEDRKAMLTRFIVFYVICVLCITVPLYYLFNIPDKVLSQLSASRFSEKNEQDKLSRIKSIMDELDSYVKENKFEKEYNNLYPKLYNLAQDSIDKADQSQIVMLKKVSDLYEQIAKIYALGGKVEIESLKKDIESMEEEIKSITKELDDCKLNYKILQLTMPKN